MILLLTRLTAVALLLLACDPLTANPDDRWDTSMGGCDGWIRDMVQGPDGLIYVGGAFSECGGVAAASVAAYDPDEDTWQALSGSGGNGINGGVHALAFYQGNLYVGGLFLETEDDEPITVNHLARWSPAAQSWSAIDSGTGIGVQNAVNVLVVFDGDLYVGGDFYRVNVGDLIEVAYVARWDGSGWSALGTDGGFGVSGGVVRAMTASDEALYVGGEFPGANGGGTDTNIQVNRVARWEGTNWSALGSGGGVGVNDRVTELAWIDGRLYAGGEFTAANVGNGIPASRAAIWDGDQWSAMSTPTGQGFNGLTDRIRGDAERIYTGGVFSAVNVGDPLSANRLTWWDGDGFGTLGSGANSRVRALLLNEDGVLYAGGLFDEIGGQSAEHFARYTTRGTLDVVFAGSGAGAVEVVPVDLNCSDDCSQSLSFDQNLTVTASPGAFSSFAGFSGDACSGTDPCTFNFEESTSIIAQFDLFSYPVSVVDVVGDGSMTPMVQAIDHGSAVSWDVTPDPGWAVYALGGDTCSPMDNGDGTWTALNITSACDVEVEFRPDVIMMVQASMNPAVVGVLVTYDIEIVATDFAPIDGQLIVSAPTGETCIDNTAPPPAVGNSVFYNCQIVYSSTGPRSLIVTYQNSTTHMFAVDTSLTQQVVSTEYIFHDRYEE